MKVKIQLRNVEYIISELSSREISLITTALLGMINRAEKDSQESEELSNMISKIEEVTKNAL